MKTTILPNGDLEVALTEGDDAGEVRESMAGYEWVRMFEANVGNGWATLPPEAIGALTDAPIVTDEYDMADDGTITRVGNVWWFPNYAVEDPAETLADKGRVVFSKAPS